MVSLCSIVTLLTKTGSGLDLAHRLVILGLSDQKTELFNSTRMYTTNMNHICN